MKFLFLTLSFFLFNAETQAAPICATDSDLKKHPCWDKFIKTASLMTGETPYRVEGIAQTELFEVDPTHNENPNGFLHRGKSAGIKTTFSVDLIGCKVKAMTYKSSKEVPLDKSNERFTFYNSDLQVTFDDKTCDIKNITFKQRPFTKEFCSENDYPSEVDLDFLDRACHAFYNLRIDLSKKKLHPILKATQDFKIKKQSDLEAEKINQECALDEELYGKAGSTLGSGKYAEFKNLLLTMHNAELGDGKTYKSFKKAPVDFLDLMVRNEVRENYRSEASRELAMRLLQYNSNNTNEVEKEKVFNTNLKIMKDFKDDERGTSLISGFDMALATHSLDSKTDKQREISSVVLDMNFDDMEVFYQESYARLLLKLDTKRLKASDEEKTKWAPTEDQQLAVLEKVFSKKGMFLARSEFLDHVMDGDSSQNIPRLEMAVRLLNKWIQDKETMQDSLVAPSFKGAIKTLNERIEKLKKVKPAKKKSKKTKTKKK